jgi:hypothetical protein
MLETILTIIAWAAVAAFTIIFLLTLPSLYFLFMEVLVIKKTRWPGPPDYDSQSTEYRMAQLMHTPYQPKPLFKGFLENVLGILGTIVILVVFIFVIIPQLNEVGTGKLIGFIILLSLTTLAGAFWIKPTLRSRARFMDWLIRR